MEVGGAVEIRDCVNGDLAVSAEIGKLYWKNQDLSTHRMCSG